ncbi:12442_t:CDS:2, partial [Dentiscutata erythropus]
NLNTSRDSKAIPTVVSITNPKIVESQHIEPVLAKDHTQGAAGLYYFKTRLEWRILAERYERGSYTNNRLYKENSAAGPINQKKRKEREEAVGSSIMEAKRKREEVGLLGDKERKSKVNNSFRQRISGNTVKMAEEPATQNPKENKTYGQFRPQ